MEEGYLSISVEDYRGDKSQRPHSIITINGAHKLFIIVIQSLLTFLKDLIENVK